MVGGIIGIGGKSEIPNDEIGLGRICGMGGPPMGRSSGHPYHWTVDARAIVALVFFNPGMD